MAGLRAAGVDVPNCCEELGKGRSLGRILVDASHDQITQMARIPRINNILHGPLKERLIDGQRIEVVAFHPFSNGGNLKHGKPNHKHFILSRPLERIKPLDPKQLELLRRQQRHRLRVFENYLVIGPSVLEQKTIDQFHLPLLVQKDAAYFDIAVESAVALEILQALHNALEDATDFRFGDWLAQLAVSLDLVEHTVSE